MRRKRGELLKKPKGSKNKKNKERQNFLPKDKRKKQPLKQLN